MPTLTTQYVYFGASGAHTRQPRATTSYGGFTPIPGLNPSGTAILATGTPFQAGLVEPTLSAAGTSFIFAFQSVSGLTEGGQVSYVASTPPPVGTVGTSPVLVLVVYVPQGIPDGNGDPGAVIDAFNETTGALVDNSFVAVTPDDSGDSITDTANVDGWVDTKNTAYTITADHPNIGPYASLPTTATFDQWVVLTDPNPPTSLVSGANLTPGKGGTVYALAFYKNPVVTKTKELVAEKNLKEFIKEKEMDKIHKENILEVGKSQVVENPIKGNKESIELPGTGNQGDPGELGGEVRALNQRVSQLEAALKASQKGKAFIKAADRPSVGTAKTRKTKDR